MSAVVALRTGTEEERRESLGRLLLVYYKPIYKHLRCKWRKTPEAAEDLAQDFFTKAVERGILGLYDPERGRFRTFIRVCVDRFVLSAIEGEGRQKRGGDFHFVAGEAADAEAELVSAGSLDHVEEAFDREWVRNLFEKSVAALEAHYQRVGRPKTFEALRLYDLDEGAERPSYDAIAQRLGVTTTDVTNYLHAARKQFRAIVLDTLRAVTVDEGEFRAEARAVLGVEV
ncbi:MAG: sigma-70 family RNA polymerase sigma factor [Polyangiaceae bacterium]